MMMTKKKEQKENRHGKLTMARKLRRLLFKLKRV